MTKRQRERLLEHMESTNPDLKRAYDTVVLREIEHKVRPGTYGSQAIVEFFELYRYAK